MPPDTGTSQLEVVPRLYDIANYGTNSDVVALHGQSFTKSLNSLWVRSIASLYDAIWGGLLIGITQAFSSTSFTVV